MYTKYDFSEEELNIIESFGTVMNDGEKRYMFLPAWVEYDENTNNYDLHFLGKLPSRLERLIEDFKI